MTLSALDCCAGAGGLSMGLHRAGFAVRGVEMDDDAVATHRLNVGPCDRSDLWEYRPERTYDLVAGGIPCFAAGTHVLTADGYRPIESIVVGDLVLTHLGRWRRVTNTMRRDDAALRAVQAQGCPRIITTDEHPFYARERGYRWDNSIRQAVRTFGDPAWTDAAKLTRAHYVAQTLPAVEPDSRPLAFWFLVGRYLADGWITDSRRTSKIPAGTRGSRVNSFVHRVTICANEQKSAALVEAIAAAGFHACTAKERTVVKFHISSQEFVAFLRPFGRYAHGKTLPGFVLALDAERAGALLDGYLAGDGCYSERLGWMATTVSESLALSIGLLAQRARGVVATVTRCKRPPTCVIEGRTVNQRDTFSVRIPPRNRSAFVDGAYGWKLVKVSEPCGEGTVYNLSVEEDESYVAGGAVVHNCQSHSLAGKRGGMLDPRGQLYTAFFRIARIARARVVLIENVRGILSSQGSAPGWKAYRELIVAAEREGYHVAHGMLNAQWYGVAQSRSRFFLVGFRDPAARAAFRWPAPTHGVPGNLLGLAPWVTVREALRLGSGAERTGPVVDGAGWQGMRGVDPDAPGYAVGTRNNADLLAPLDPRDYCECGHWRDEHAARGAGRCLYESGACGCAAWEPRRDLPGLGLVSGGGMPLSPLDRPSNAVTAREGRDGARGARGARGGVARGRGANEGLRDALSALDRPSPAVTCREQASAVAFGSRGAVTGPRRAGDRINPALALLDAPSAAVSAGGTDAGGAEPFANARYRARLATALEEAGLADRPSTTVLGHPALPPAGHHDHVRAEAVDPLRESGLLDRPSTTVDTTNGVAPAGVHERNKRAVRLTIEQLAALQDFPPGFRFVGNKGSQHRMVGNACPATLARVVGESIVAALLAAGVVADG